MSTSLPLQVLLAPLVIAITTIATMLLLNGARAPRRVSAELGYTPDAEASVAMTVGRYVGGHPAAPAPHHRPYMLLTPQHLALFAGRWGQKVFLVPWEKVELMNVLSREEVGRIAGTVRGLPDGILEEAPEETFYLRVRFEDDRGWWQNMLFELDPALAGQQGEEALGYWKQRQADPPKEPSA